MKEIYLLSKSPERREILRKQGFNILFPGTFKDCESQERTVEYISSPMIFQKDILDRKLRCYFDFINEIRLKSSKDKDNFFLIADSIVYIKSFEKPKIFFVFSKVKNSDEFIFLFKNYYYRVDSVFIRTSQYLIRAKDSFITKKFQSGLVELSFLDQNGMTRFDWNLLDKYLETKRELSRAGGIDIMFFQEEGFNIKGDIQVAKGIVPLKGFANNSN